MECDICKKIFKNIRAVNAHKIIHSDKNIKKLHKWRNSLKIYNDIQREKNSKFTKQCKGCESFLIYDKRKNVFCSKSCSASFNNKKRCGISEEQKIKISETLKNKPLKHITCDICNIEYTAKNIKKKCPFCETPKKFYDCNCRKCIVCNTEFFTLPSKNRKFCKNCNDMKKIQLHNWSCPICEKILLLTTYEMKKKKYCSGICRNVINNKSMKGSRSKAEKMLEESLKIAFPHWEILFNDRKVLNGLELDVYIPHLKFAIEWNGIFHFEDIHNNGKLDKIFNRDLLKIDLCKTLGISLLSICDRTSHTKFIKETISELIEKLKNI